MKAYRILDQSNSRLLREYLTNIPSDGPTAPWAIGRRRRRPFSAQSAGWAFTPVGWTPHDSGFNLKGGTARGHRSAANRG